MTTAIPAQSFINPPLQEGVSSLKLFLHNFYSLGRTNVLRHILHPTPESIDGLLKRVWARAHLCSFSSPSEAQDTISHELSMVHPLALKRYETAIKTADTFEKIKDLANNSFKTTDRAAKDLKQAISIGLDKKLPDPNEGKRER